MKRSGNSSNHNPLPEGQDDFQKIKGIGKSIAQALNGLGITTYADLAAYSPDHLMEQLKGRLPPIALQRARPEEWVHQAQALSQQQPLSRESSGRQANRAGRNWREIADFFVSFGYEVQADGQEHLKTRAHHSQEDQLMEWEGLELEDLAAWMLERVELKPSQEVGEAAHPTAGQSELAEPLPSEADSEPEAIRLELINLWVSEVTMPVAIQGQQQTGYLRLDGTLQISGLDAESSTYERLEYNLELYLIDTETKQSMLVRTFTDHLEPGRLEYPLQQDFEIPPVGRYQLFVAATLPASSADAAHLQGPVIEVEP
jgi:hypothetical protein